MTTPESCGAKMVSKENPAHTHECGPKHLNGDHVCRYPTCRRWFWPAGEPRFWTPEESRHAE